MEGGKATRRDTDSAEESTNKQKTIINRTSSIEAEPRTLHLDQIGHAREAAMYVMNTSSVEAALRIFTEGLEPVNRRRTTEDEQRCGTFDSLHRRESSSGFKDVATAPF